MTDRAATRRLWARSLAPLRKSFTVRVYLAVVALLVALTASLTAVSVRAQTRLLADNLYREGRNLADLLASGGRVRAGLFAGNADLVTESADAVARRPDVVVVAVFDDNDQLLVRSEGPAPGPKQLELPAPAPSGPFDVNREDDVTFWAAVYTSEAPATEEELYLDPAYRGPARIRVGRVAITLSKRQLRQTRRAILGRAGAVAGASLLLAGLLTALVVREATAPLRRLLAEAREHWPSTGAGDEADDVSRLTDTFGGLVRSLDGALGQLNELTGTLERRVEEGTAELRDANEELLRAREELEARVLERTEEVEATHRQLLHAEKLSAVGRLAASVAHEFNNPLFGIRNVLVGLGKEPGLEPDARELADLAVGECDRLARLIRDLQGFHRPSAEKPSPVHLERALDAVLLLCRKELNVKHATLEKAYAPTLPVVWGVEDQLRQVFLNLVTNAMDALPPEGGILHVATEVASGSVVVRVGDNGAGIPPEVLGRIFEPFFTTKPEVKGTGLGLTVSHGIITSHGGTLEVESAPGRGSTFTVKLPVEGALP